MISLFGIPFRLLPLPLQGKKIPLQVEHRHIITDNDYQFDCAAFAFHSNDGCREGRGNK